MDSEKESSYNRDNNEFRIDQDLTKLVRGPMDKDLKDVTLDKKEDDKLEEKK